MPPKLPIKLFAGPSLSAWAQRLAEIKEVELLPPVRRFDLPRLLAEGYRGVLVIADGFFYQDMSVGHAEIREALDAGCRVWGLSSMGAIRAFEMKAFGMRGYGKVYDWFFSQEDFQDDEVALLHQDDPPYRALSEPLVHFRECLRTLRHAGQIDRQAESEIVDSLKFRFFGDRTLSLFQALLDEYTSLDSHRILTDFNRHRIKLSDLERFLEEEAWGD